MTDEKNLSGLAKSTSSGAPVVLLKVLRNPLRKTTNCDGPTAPIESGGKAPVSAGPRAARNVVPTVCAVGCAELMFVEEIVVVVETVRAGPGGVCRSNRAFGCCGRFSLPGISR